MNFRQTFILLLGVLSSECVSKHPLVIIIGLDGFRHDYLDELNTPNLHSLMENGISVPYMDPVFPTFSLPNFHSLSTGLFPESHGITENIVYDRRDKKFYNGRIDEDGYWHYREDVLPLWVLNEISGEGRFSGAYRWLGSHHGFGKNNELFPSYYIPDIDDFEAAEVGLGKVMSWITNEEKPANLIMWYVNLDYESHVYGPGSAQVKATVNRIDKMVGLLIQSLKEVSILQKTNIIVVGDHGSTGSTRQQVINLTSLIDLSLVDVKLIRTPITQLQPRQGKFDELYESLVNLSRSHPMTVYKRGEIEGYSFSRRILDIIVTPHEGWSFEDMIEYFDWYDDKWHLSASPNYIYGNHGYSPKGKDMKTIFIAHGPAFKKGLKHDVISILDVFPLVSKILGIPVPPNNGSWTRVRDMLEPSYLNGVARASVSIKSTSSLVIAVMLIVCFRLVSVLYHLDRLVLSKTQN